MLCSKLHPLFAKVWPQGLESYKYQVLWRTFIDALHNGHGIYHKSHMKHMNTLNAL
jgi:hypothetical protein